MIDLAVMFMELCYGIMCIQYGWYKAKEALYLHSKKGVALVFTFVIHTILAPNIATYELMTNVK